MKLENLRDQENLWKMRSNMPPQKSPTVSALPTPDFQPLKPELMISREESKLSSHLQRWKLLSRALHGEMLKPKEKPSLIQLKDNSLRRNLRNFYSQSKPTSKLLMSPNERQLNYNENIYIVG
jgi:hypothetical protein